MMQVWQKELGCEGRVEWKSIIEIDHNLNTYLEHHKIYVNNKENKHSLSNRHS